jgi:hypothetical protein
VRDGVLDIEIRGAWSHFMHMSGDQHIAISDVVEVGVASWDEVRPALGWRTGGGYWPGWFATGWYSMKGRPGTRQFLSVFRDRDRLLVIDTVLERPARLVLAVPEPERLADEIRAELADSGH